MPPARRSRNGHSRVIQERRVDEKGETTYSTSLRTLIGRFTNYKAQGETEHSRGTLAIASINMPAFALSSTSFLLA